MAADPSVTTTTAHSVAAATTAHPSSHAACEGHVASDATCEPHPAANSAGSKGHAAPDSTTDPKWTTDVSAEPAACNRSWVPVNKPVSIREMRHISIIELVAV